MSPAGPPRCPEPPLWPNGPQNCSAATCTDPSAASDCPGTAAVHALCVTVGAAPEAMQDSLAAAFVIHRGRELGRFGAAQFSTMSLLRPAPHPTADRSSYSISRAAWTY